jgi:hypothetical protein
MAQPDEDTGVGLSHARFVSICPDVGGIGVKRCKEANLLAPENGRAPASLRPRPYVTKHKPAQERATFPGNFYCAFEHSAAKD